jgi:hypothetical protein
VYVALAARDSAIAFYCGRPSSLIVTPSAAR